MTTEPELIRQRELNRLRLESAWTITKPPDGSFATDSPLSPQNIANQPVKTIQQMQLDNAYKAPAYTPSTSAPVEPSNLWAQKLQAEATLNRTYTSSEQEQLKRVSAQESLASKGLKTRDSGSYGANNTNPNASSTASTQAPVPQNSPQSINSQLGIGALIYAGAYVGDAVGDRASNAVFGTSNGFFSNLLGGVGALAGGVLGSTLLGSGTLGTGAYAGYFGGSALGNGFGSFLGSALDKLFGSGNPTPDSNKANPNTDKGKNYINPDALAALQPSNTYGYSGGTEVYQLLVDLADGRTNFFVFEFTQGNFYIDSTNSNAISGSVTFVNGTTASGYLGSLNVVGFRVKNSLGTVVPPNPAPEPPFVPNATTSQGAGFDGSPFDALTNGEKYQDRTGRKEPPVLPDATKPDPNKPRVVAPNPSLPSIPNSPLLGSKPAFSDKSLASNPNPTGIRPNSLPDPVAVAGTGRVTNPVVDPIKATPVITPPPTPKTPNDPSTDDYATAKVLGAVAVVTGLALYTKNLLDYVNTTTQNTNLNTQPTAQQTNAKQGVCDAMQPAQCGFEGVKQAATEATNPIKDIANDNKGALAGLLALLQAIETALTAFITAALSKLDKIKDFLDLNNKIESVKSTITLALTIHNALMLSQSLGDTLGLIIDNVLNVFGNTFRTTEGSQISASEYLGATVKNWIINVIGTENYVQLSETLAQANRIYQTGMNILSTTQGMFDAAASAAQASGIKLSLLMNGLRDESVVSPRAYGHQDESALGNRALLLNRFTQLTTTISDADSKAQNLVTITSAPIQIKDSVKQTKDDITAFNAARDASSAENVAAKQAKIDEIKALKPLTEATISKRDDDT